MEVNNHLLEGFVLKLLPKLQDGLIKCRVEKIQLQSWLENVKNRISYLRMIYRGEHVMKEMVTESGKHNGFAEEAPGV